MFKVLDTMFGFLQFRGQGSGCRHQTENTQGVYTYPLKTELLKSDGEEVLDGTGRRYRLKKDEYRVELTSGKGYVQKISNIDFIEDP